MTLHRGLKFRNADVGSDTNTLDRDIGNVSSTTRREWHVAVMAESTVEFSCLE